MKPKKITNNKALEKLQKAIAEIGIFDQELNNMQKGNEINWETLKRIQKAAVDIILFIPEL